MQRSRALLLVCVVLADAPSLADPSPAYLVKDINTQPAPLLDMNTRVVEMGGVGYFTATTSEAMQLWRTDGTAAGTSPVKDFGVITSGVLPGLVVSNGKLFFSADDGTTGPALWTSDGTTAGTTLVADVQTGFGGTWPDQLVDVNGTLFFRGQNGGTLYKSNGTPTGTVIVATRHIDHLVNVNGTLFFSSGELWKSDGTSAGTVMVKDIAPGTSSSSPDLLVNVAGTVYFTANDGTHGIELWKSDGTDAGTVLVKDIVPGSGSSTPTSLAAWNGLLFFTADDGANGSELWKSDGTDAGTVLVKDISPGSTGSTPSDFVVANGKLFFTADDGQHDREVWTTDGTVDGTTLLKDVSPLSYINPTWLTNGGDRLYFVQYDPVGGVELFQSDGTTGGTVMTADVWAGPNGSYPEFLGMLNGALLFQAFGASGQSQLWKSDGTSEGTQAITGLATGNALSASYSNPAAGSITKSGDFYFFSANDGIHGTELWKTDGTAAGTVMVKDVNPGPTSTQFLDFRDINGTLFFAVTAQNPAPPCTVNCYELWKSDGTEAGTVRVTGTQSSWSLAPMLTNVNDTLFFWSGSALWKSDGTSAGTVLVKPTGAGAPVSEQSLVALGGTLFFSAGDPPFGGNRELWKSDGTDAGTVRVAEIRPSGGSDPADFAVFNGALFFSADDGVHGRELWKSDGTAAGTVLVADLWPGNAGGTIASSSPTSLTDVNGTLYFLATPPAFNRDVWRSDGTAAGTVYLDLVAPLVMNLNLMNASGTLFFSAEDPTHGRELWKTDGTPAGTQLLKDIWPGPTGLVLPDASNPALAHVLVPVGSNVVFAANDSVSGRELWTSDGTSIGTREVADVSALGGSNPSGITRAGSLLLFSATTPETGRELYAVPVAALTDADLDGLLDTDERALGTDVFVADTDGDGLSDGAEVHTYGTNPLLADTDGDHVRDGDEILAGTNPLDPHSFPVSVPLVPLWSYAALAALLLATTARVRSRARGL